MTKHKGISKHIRKEKQRQRCEIFSRVVGYFRPVDQWNEAKQEEFSDRKEFKV